MGCMKDLFKILGLAVLAFGVGILITFFLPSGALIVIEAVVIIAAGLFYLLQR